MAIVLGSAALEKICVHKKFHHNTTNNRKTLKSLKFVSAEEQLNKSVNKSLHYPVQISLFMSNRLSLMLLVCACSLP